MHLNFISPGKDNEFDDDKSKIVEIFQLLYPDSYLPFFVQDRFSMKLDLLRRKRYCLTNRNKGVRVTDMFVEKL